MPGLSMKTVVAQEAESAARRNKTSFRLLPTWKGNLILFGILVLLVIVYYFGQIREAQRFFFEQTRHQAETVADIIRRNAENATLSEKIIEDILDIFLGNSAKFVDYLNSVTPFSSEELTAFASEAGLTGISIVPKSQERIDGPKNWLLAKEPCGTVRLSVDKTYPQYVLAYPMPSGAGCVVVGIETSKIKTLLEQISLSKLLETLTGLDPITYVRIEKDIPPRNNKPEVHLITVNGQAVAESHIRMDADCLVVGLDARIYTETVRGLWGEFAMFSSALVGLGAFFSWLLYRYQQLYVVRVRELDRELARQREDAALGLATASIAHEIRNPLNAISMGLQRLQIETENLAPDHMILIDAMRQAVSRSNEIVTNLKRYAAPISLTVEPVDLKQLIERVLALYHEPFRLQGIETHFDSQVTRSIPADGNLLPQVIENMVKNAVEAQPNGGFLRIRHFIEADMSMLTFENGGFKLPAEKLEQIFEPYITTKMRGTGLGLSIAKRIIEAHGGGIGAEISGAETIRLSICLPLSAEKGTPA
jgi:two-component system, NtrC family, sensor histidine kinase HydH